MDATFALQLIRAGESDTVEFKMWSKQARTDLAETAVCLANHRGGHILLGVRDDGAITGCRDYDVEELRRSVFDGTDPHLTVGIHEVELPDGVVLVVEVPRSPVVHATSSGRIIRRTGTSCRPVSPGELAPLFVDKGILDYTALPMAGATTGALDPAEVERLRRLYAERNPTSELNLYEPPDWLAALSLTATWQGATVPTVAGLLLAGDAAALRRLLPQCTITYLHYPGADVDYDFREEIQLPLVAALRRVQELVDARNRLSQLPVGLLRFEIWDFPPDVYREAILNALTHRDWTRPEGVLIHHRPDRLEIENPGGLPEGITPANILHHPPKHRNPLLAGFFQRLGFVEKAGAGVNRMYRSLLMAGKEPPEYVAWPDAVKVILRDGSYDHVFARLAHEENQRGSPLGTDELLVLSHLRRNRQIDRTTAANLCQRSEREAGEILAGMVRRGLLERMGRTRAIVWRLSAGVYRRLSEESGYVRDRGVDPARHTELVQEHVRRWGSITNTACRELCGLTAPQASRLLGSLVRTGVLVRHGAGRGARYFPGPAEAPPAPHHGETTHAP